MVLKPRSVVGRFTKKATEPQLFFKSLHAAVISKTYQTYIFIPIFMDQLVVYGERITAAMNPDVKRMGV